MDKTLNRRQFGTMVGGALSALALGCAHEDRLGFRPQEGQEPPNILWVIGEDLCPDLGCYGHPLVLSPNIDQLAAEGVRFDQAFATSPVCSPSRCAFNTGMYQISTDTHHHRSHRSDNYQLPEGVKLVSEVFRENGYYTFNASCPDGQTYLPGKTDFNFQHPNPFDGADWRDRREGQPFFGAVNFMEAHRGYPFDEVRERGLRLDPADVELPPYYPDHPVVREHCAIYLEAIETLDRKVGMVLDRLEQDGLADNTIVIFFGDHGQAMLRGKQWLYDAGIHVPFIIRWPGRIKGGVSTDRLVSLLDLGAICTNLAGIEPPPIWESQPVYGPDAVERDCIFAARDRCDETLDRIRCVRTNRYKYIRNYMPERGYTSRNRYIEANYPTLEILKEHHAQGRLNEAQALFLQPEKPREELYDLSNDPYEVRNLANDPAHATVLDDLRTRLDAWIEETGDTGQYPEPDEAIENYYNLPLSEYR